ncbi:hypothetical protein AX16_011039 [Volvariella volvacea WC 439]|nr:hypothetical protein AX16_011039 [Volvariella volvacea WC 439]
MSFQATPLEDLPTIYNTVQLTFRTHKTKPLAYRAHQLLQLARMVQENAPAFAQALALDLGRPSLEAYAGEIAVVVERALVCADKLHQWVHGEEDFSDRVPEWKRSWRPRVFREPRGAVLIIAPWNYPMILSLQPLYGAISAGCTAVLKLSEVAPHYATTLAGLLPKYLDNDAYKVVLGAVPEVTRLLEFKWDYIFYTGNARIARIISAAAAKHLTPTTLELGGKSPVIVDESCDLDLAAKRILWGKTCNAGQICVSPDYVLIPAHLQQAFTALLAKHIHAFFPDGPLNSPHFSRIVSKPHYERLKAVLQSTKGKIVVGGKWVEGEAEAEGGLKLKVLVGGEEHEVDKDGQRERTRQKRALGIEPTVVADVAVDDVLLEEEIFGPILPIVPVKNVDEALAVVNSKSHPLVLYVFAGDEHVKEYIRERTRSGGITYNDTFIQLSVDELPFGGVGESGHGRQVLKFSFDAFTYERSSIDVPKSAEQALGNRYPPYTPENLEFMKGLAKVRIPSEEEVLEKWGARQGHKL